MNLLTKFNIHAPRLLVASVFCCIIAPIASAQVCFSTTTYQAQLSPTPVIAVDLNGDGHMDLVVGDLGTNSISVLLNNGDGTFAAQVVYAMGEMPWGLAAGDLNGDQLPDVVSANYGAGSSNLSVRLNLGGGVLGPVTTLQAGARPISPVIIDVDRDGHNDIVVANFVGNSFSVLRSLGNMTFAPAVTYPTGTHPQGFTMGNLDHDQFPDAVAVDIDSDSISVFHNNGDGTFANRVAYTTGHVPYYAAIADLDGDGDLDIAVTNYNNGGLGSVSIFLNNGNGTFAPKVDFAAGFAPLGIVAADFDGDCAIDLVIGSPTGLLVLLNNGSGGFPTQRTVGAFNRVYCVAAAQLDNAPGTDIAAAEFGENSGNGTRVGVALNNCWLINSQPESRVACPLGGAQFSIAAAGAPEYRWRRNGVPLVNGITATGSVISGATSSLLEIAAVSAADAAGYDCVVTSSCGSRTSASAQLTVCVANFNCDSIVDFFDYLDFVTAFASNDPAADFNGDSVIDFFDYLDFVAAFSQGC